LFAAKWLFLLSATGAKAFATQYGPSGRRLERNSVGLPTLVAGNIVTLAVAAATTSAASATAAAAAEIRAARITALLATFRLTQIPFLIVILFALSKRKWVPALSAGNLYVRHDRFLHEKARPGPP
jgi:hypothetical protein